MKTTFLRALEADDKAAALFAMIRDPEAALGRQHFEVDTASFGAIPRSPFSYWVSDDLRRLFRLLPPFESHGRQAQHGLSTKNDFRYLRLSWEIVGDIAVERPASGWLPFAKGGAFKPYYSDVHLLVKWIDEGREIEAEVIQKFPYLNGNAEWVMHRECNYLRPGLTWPRRTNGLSFRVMPSGCVFADKGPAAFVENDAPDELLALAAVANSKAFGLLVSLQLARTELAQSFEVGLIQRTPIPILDPAKQSNLVMLARRAWSLKRSLDTCSGTSHAFTLPAVFQVDGDTLVARTNAWAQNIRAIETEVATIQTEIDARCFDLYGMDEADRRVIVDGLSGAVDELGDTETDADANEDTDDENESTHSNADAVRLAAELVSWAVGVAFGRFDVRLATGARPLPQEPNPFGPLPVCSPAMLTGDEGLPLPSPPAGYPVAFPQNGILVDDLGHACDLVAAVRTVFDEVFEASADAWWNEVGALLDPKDHDLRTWLASGFFEHHLKSHSRSRRKAPIMWQLAVPSGRYSIWLYAHGLRSDSFFQIQNDVVIPKIAHEERQLTDVKQSAGAHPSAAERKEIVAQEAFVDELRALLDEVKRVAPFWKPTLDDGVALTMAPLWRLVPHHKPWQKELRSKWDELAAGTYDWAHLAMQLWPERVVPKCTTDRSLAIAHGLEDVFWVEDLSVRWQQRVSIAETVTYLTGALLSDRVRKTVDELTAFSTTFLNEGSGDADWWDVLSTQDTSKLALALWPKRVLTWALDRPGRLDRLGIATPRAPNRLECLAKLLHTYRPRHSQQELQAVEEYCILPGDKDGWKQRWSELLNGDHDNFALARFLFPARIVTRAQADARFSRGHDLFRWFWVAERTTERRLLETAAEEEKAIRDRTSAAVKDALKTLLEAPVASGIGRRGRGRRAASGALDRGAG